MTKMEGQASITFTPNELHLTFWSHSTIVQTFIRIKSKICDCRSNNRHKWHKSVPCYTIL